MSRWSTGRNRKTNKHMKYIKGYEKRKYWKFTIISSNIYEIFTADNRLNTNVSNKAHKVSRRIHFNVSISPERDTSNNKWRDRGNKSRAYTVSSRVNQQVHLEQLDETLNLALTLKEFST